ncbi:MAG: 16S rRNA (guanine(966)-N(2))-methyltransferase RsmD [Alphaproteobacteria bacterium]|nr:16S rRNA (guanine(966)-N(2))-methyltransferase RsmD [Alphaproteobacteria bacterium]
MRVIAGKHRGRPLARPPAMITRPTMDRVRESIFNMLTHADIEGKMDYVQGANVLDAYAGSGALGIECISRGAKFIYFFDKNTRALATVRENVWSLGEADSTKIMKADATQPPQAPFAMDLVLLDPPFGKNLTALCLPHLLKAGWIDEKTLIVAEIAAKEELNLPGNFTLLRERVYGTAQVFFIQLKSEE